MHRTLTHTHSPTHIGLLYVLEAASAATILADKLSSYTHTHPHPGKFMLFAEQVAVACCLFFIARAMSKIKLQQQLQT